MGRWWGPGPKPGGVAPDAAPTLLTATFVSVNQIDLDWTDNATNESGYKIERKIAPGSFVEIAAIATPGLQEYSDHSVVEDTVYTYRVRAYKGSKVSAYSNEATEETLPSPPVQLVSVVAGSPLPLAPTNLVVVFNAIDDIDLTWTDNSNNETGFDITRNEQFIDSVGAGVTSYTDTGAVAEAEPDGALQYGVRATNSSGESDYTRSTPIDTPPGAPSGLVLEVVSDTAIDLTWVDGASVEDGFKIERKEEGGVFAEIASIATPNLQSYSDTTLTAATTYTYRVRAYNTTGNSGYSNEASATTDAALTAPSVPQFFSVGYTSDTQIDLAWLDTSDNELGFRIERSDNGGAFTQIAEIATPNSFEYFDTTVSGDNAYVYRIRAYNAAGNSPYTPTEAIETKPAAPSVLTATAISDSTIQLAWTNNSDINTAVDIYRKVGTGAYQLLLASSNPDLTSHEDTGLSASTAYTYRVQARATRLSAFSNEASATTDAEEPGITQVTGFQSGGFTVPAGDTYEISGHVTSDGNVVVKGTLRMRAGSTLEFININESLFVFDSSIVPATDVGLYILGNGKLDAVGTSKEPWIRAADSIAASAPNILLASTPTGWLVGDEISVLPTASDDFDPEIRTIADVSGNTVTLNSPLTRAHPSTTLAAVQGSPAVTYTAEVLNLTRDVKIMGQATGRAHVMWMHDPDDMTLHGLPPVVEYVEMRHLGVPKSDTQQSGRYGMHFHQFNDALRGTNIIGVVQRDINNHCYVSHQTNGITFTKCISYNTFGKPYWWDDRDPVTGERDTLFSQSDDIFYDRCVAAIMYKISTINKLHNAGMFNLQRGERCKCIGCVAVCAMGGKRSGGFEWPSQANKPPHVWTFEDCLAHNHPSGGTFIWQNDRSVHTQDRFDVYGNGSAGNGPPGDGFGILQGAYGSPGYRWFSPRLRGSGWGHGVKLFSQAHMEPISPGLRSDGYTLIFEDGWISNWYEGIGNGEHISMSAYPCLFRNIVFENLAAGLMTVDEPDGTGIDQLPLRGLRLDMVDCTIDGNPIESTDVTFVRANAEFRLRVQNGSTAWQMDNLGAVTVIPVFYPS